MKKNLPITDNERVVESHERIISSTNLKGAIEHVNQDFLNISGFTEEELTHKNHNIVRHPDMPPAAFKQAWDYLKAGKQWKGIGYLHRILPWCSGSIPVLYGFSDVAVIFR